MAKNTRSAEFRRVDVDQYLDEKYRDDEGEDEGAKNGTTGIGPNNGEVQALLSQLFNRGRTQEALNYVLGSLPITTKDQAIKNRIVDVVLRVLLSFKAADIEDAIRCLDATKLDILMKYIYRGFEFPSEGSSAQLLIWHEKVFAAGGLGCIVRVLTDRKRV